MRPKFIADNDLNQDIVTGLWLREPALDFWSAIEGGTGYRSDPEVLSIAAKSGRILVSHDCNTMIRHFFQFVRHSNSPGLLIVAQKLPVGAVIDEIELIWSASDAREYLNVLEFLSINPGG